MIREMEEKEEQVPAMLFANVKACETEIARLKKDAPRVDKLVLTAVNRIFEQLKQACDLLINSGTK